MNIKFIRNSIIRIFKRYLERPNLYTLIGVITVIIAMVSIIYVGNPDVYISVVNDTEVKIGLSLPVLISCIIALFTFYILRSISNMEYDYSLIRNKCPDPGEIITITNPIKVVNETKKINFEKLITHYSLLKKSRFFIKKLTKDDLREYKVLELVYENCDISLRLEDCSTKNIIKSSYHRHNKYWTTKAKLRNNKLDFILEK